MRRLGSLTLWVDARSNRSLSAARYRVAVTVQEIFRCDDRSRAEAAFGWPWRQTERMLGSIMDLLGLDLPVPDQTTFSRRSVDLGVATALTKVDGSVHVVIDSTGLKVFGIGEWLHASHGGKPRRTWRKLHLAVDPDSGGILAS